MPVPAETDAQTHHRRSEAMRSDRATQRDSPAWGVVSALQAVTGLLTAMGSRLTAASLVSPPHVRTGEDQRSGASVLCCKTCLANSQTRGKLHEAFATHIY